MKTLFRALLWLVVLMVSNSALAQATAPDVFKAARPDMEPPLVAALRTEYGSANVTLIQVNTDVLRAAAADAPVMLNVTPTLRFAGVTRETQALGQGRYLWRGELSGAGDLPEGSATLVINGNNLTGSITSPQGDTYRIQPVGNGVNAVIKVDKYLNEGPAQRPDGGDMPEPKSSADPGGTQVAADGEPIIDVLVVYTPSAATASGDILSLIDLAMNETNTSLANSQISARLHLAGTMQVTYTEPKTANGHNDWIQMLDFVTFDSAAVAQRRNAVGADLVVFLVHHTGVYCGMGWLNSPASHAFSAVHHGCATGNYTFGHEIGHNIGAHHDTETHINAHYAYGHGHLQREGRWRTIMSYPCKDGGCPTRIQHWSNPSVSYGGRPTGTIATDNNARVWNERAAVVAAFRSPPAYTVSTSAGNGGTISPTSVQVNTGATHTFTVTPNAGYFIASISGCGGAAVTGNNMFTTPLDYTTGAINAACTVSVTFAPVNAGPTSYTVSTDAGNGGAISPTSVQVNTGATHTFTVTPNAGYFIASISGCGGAAVTGNNTFTTPLDYTTGAINAACTVSATFAEVTAGPTFQRAVSRKEHRTAAGVLMGTFDLPISAVGAITVEPRTGGSNRAFEVVFQFAAPVSEAGLNAALTEGTGTITETEVVGNEVIMKLTGVPDGTRLGITLTVGGVANAASANIGFLSGKVGGGGVVNQTDVTGVRTHVGAMLSEANFIYDLDTDGTINQTDVTSVRTAVGQVLQ